jgi:hypothetical protein
MQTTSFSGSNNCLRERCGDVPAHLESAQNASVRFYMARWIIICDDKIHPDLCRFQIPDDSRFQIPDDSRFQIPDDSRFQMIPDSR